MARTSLEWNNCPVFCYTKKTSYFTYILKFFMVPVNTSPSYVCNETKKLLIILLLIIITYLCIILKTYQLKLNLGMATLLCNTDFLPQEGVANVHRNVLINMIFFKCCYIYGFIFWFGFVVWKRIHNKNNNG